MFIITIILSFILGIGFIIGTGALIELIRSDIKISFKGHDVKSYVCGIAGFCLTLVLGIIMSLLAESVIPLYITTVIGIIVGGMITVSIITD